MIDYELEFLSWRERQLFLREKYADTPPGLKREQAWQEKRDLEAAWKEYREQTHFRLTGSVLIPEEPFVGRGAELQEIRRMFSEGCRAVFLSGMGGIGKSALARAYGRVYAGEYDRILLWNYDKSLEQIFADDGQLAISNLAYSQNRYRSRRQYAKEKYEKLAGVAGAERLLIILDNFNRKEDPWFAFLEGISCDLLVTTRLSGASLSEEGYAFLSVERLVSEEDWRDFYRIYTGKEPKGQEWEKIMAYRDSVEGHTLKMKLALSNPEQKWDAKRLAKSLLSCFRLKKPQVQVLCELSFLTIAGIPEEVYLSCTEEKREDVEILKTYSLIQEKREALKQDASAGRIFLSLHPVVSEAVMLTWHPDLTRCLKFIEKLAGYIRFSRYRPREGDLWLMPQVTALVERLPKPVAWRYYIYECLATFLAEWEHFDEAEAIRLPLYECVREYYGEGHQFTAYMALRVASVYYNSMHFEKSKEWYAKSIRFYRAASPVTKSFYHDKAEAGTKLGRVYEYEGNYEAAHRCLDLAQEAMENFRKETEEADPKLWELRRNRWSYIYLRRATLYFKQGDLDRAQRELDIGLNLFPLDEFQELEIRRLQTSIYLKRGGYLQVRKAARRDPEVCVRYLGESYKVSLTFREVLGAMGEAQAEAGEYLKTFFLLQERYPYQTEWGERLQKS